jgi:hypothetical protein
LSDLQYILKGSEFFSKKDSKKLDKIKRGSIFAIPFAIE